MPEHRINGSGPCDADGTGATRVRLIATLATGLSLTADDVFVV